MSESALVHLTTFLKVARNQLTDIQHPDMVVSIDDTKVLPAINFILCTQGVTSGLYPECQRTVPYEKYISFNL